MKIKNSFFTFIFFLFLVLFSGCSSTGVSFSEVNVTTNVFTDFGLFGYGTPGYIPKYSNVTNNLTDSIIQDNITEIIVNGSMFVNGRGTFGGVDVCLANSSGCPSFQAGPFANNSYQIFIQNQYPKYVNLSDSLFVNGSNKYIGININNASQPLHVVGQGPNKGAIRIDNDGAGSTVVANRQDGKAVAIHAGPTSGSFTFDNTGIFKIYPRPKSQILTGTYTATADYFVMNGTTGHVGINTDTPQVRLHVYEPSSDIYTKIETDSGDVRFDLDGTTSSQLRFLRNGDPKWFLYSPSDDNLYLADDFGNDLLIATQDGNFTFTKNGNFSDKLYTQNYSGKNLFLSDMIIANGTFGNGDDLPISGKGSKLIWYPKKSAFRAGAITSGNRWDDPKIGNYSVAFGRNTEASGTYSFAAGIISNASGYKSVALIEGQAIGRESFALGDEAKAIGSGSVVFGGDTNEAYGQNSFILGGSDNKIYGRNSFILDGQNNINSGNFSIIIGQYMNLSQNSENTFVFGVSNVTQNIEASNSFLIFPKGENGNVGIGTTTTDNILTTKATSSNQNVMGVRNSADTRTIVSLREGTGGIGEMRIWDSGGTLRWKLSATGDSYWNDITTSDHFGIGLSTPNHKLDVYGNSARLRGPVAGELPFIIENPSSNINNRAVLKFYRATDYDWRLKAGSNNFVVRDHQTGNDVITMERGALDDSIYINGSGYVGLGTNSPTHKLNVIGEANITNTLYSQGHRVCLENGTGCSGLNKEIIWENNSNQVYIKNGYPNYVNISDALYINGTNKRTGIGTTTPNALLDTTPDTIDSTTYTRPFPTINTTQRNALTSLVEGAGVYDIIEDTLRLYDGSKFQAQIPKETVNVYDLNDLPTVDGNGRIPLEYKRYLFPTATPFVLPYPLDMTNGATIAQGTFVYVGSGPFFHSANITANNVILDSIIVIDNAETEVLFNLTSTNPNINLIIDKVAFSGFNSLGKINGITIGTSIVKFLEFGNGLTIEDAPEIAIYQTGFISTKNVSTSYIACNGTSSVANLIGNTYFLGGTNNNIFDFKDTFNAGSVAVSSSTAVLNGGEIFANDNNTQKTVGYKFSGNVNIPDSTTKQFAFFSDSSNLTTIAASDTPVKINATWTDNTIQERFNFTSDGRFCYLDDEDITVDVTSTITVDPTSGAASSWKGYITINQIIQNQSVFPVTVGTGAALGAMIPNAMFNIEKYDCIETWISRDAGSTGNIVATDGRIKIFKI